MTKVFFLIVAGAFLLGFSAPQQKNPFFSDYNTPFETPPFDKINETHYMPAFKAGIMQQQQEIAAITDNSDAPTFKNTVEALEESGALLTKVSNVFGNLTAAHTNDKLQELDQQITPMLSQHNDDIMLNEMLFQRIKTVYDQKERFNLTAEQTKLLDEYYKSFVRGGANLNDAQKDQLREINTELSLLTLQFGENLLKETNAFEMVLDNQADLVGLPEAVVIGAAETAQARGHEGKWVFTLDKPSWIPFLQYSPKRNLREKIYQAYINAGNNNNEYDNKKILSRIAALRVQKANLMGFPTHAHFVLEENMAQVPANVYDLLNRIWKPALETAQAEAADMQKMIADEGDNFKLESWDWWYYAEKVKKAKYDLDEEQLRPYFKLENVRDGAFAVAHKLYGITFTECSDIPVYHPDVKVFEVQELDGRHIGIIYVDYFPRASKRGGAWMNSYRKQFRVGGKESTPIVCNVCNLSKPTGDKPALLSFEEVTTLFHEFGHALHGLLSDSTYPTLSGTAVPRDFVELPSQIMENWATDPKVIKTYAQHYQTGETMPQELIDKIQNARYFNQGFITVEYLAASLLDMDWHTLTEPVEHDALKFEKASMDKNGLISEIIPRYRSFYFRHIFSGGYSAGYYSYIWAQVLDADAFGAFKETTLYDQQTAQAFRRYILAAGNTDDPMTMYKRFRGAEPKIDALLKRRGFIK